VIFYLSMQELKCGLGGEWSGKPLVCRFVDCGPPQIIENGMASLVNDTTTHGSIVEYTCEQDYWLQPHTSRRQICTKEAKWSADPPTCQREYNDYIIIIVRLVCFFTLKIKNYKKKSFAVFLDRQWLRVKSPKCPLEVT